MLAYIRVSTDRQATEDRTSLADQEAAIVALPKARGTVAQWFKDEEASGATVEGRPEFQRLLWYCERHPRPPIHQATFSF